MTCQDTSTYQDIRYELTDRVLTLTINRPEQRNTVTYRVLDELIDAFRHAGEDEEVRAVVVTGAGRYFSAGTDLASRDGYNATADDFKPLRGGTRDVGGILAEIIYDLPKPVIAAMNGTAVGIGITMTLPMDVRIVAEGAKLGLPFTRRGIVPESCANFFLPRVVGIATAVEWATSGRLFGPDEALRAGLVSRVLPAAEVLPAAQALAREIAENAAPVAVALTRQLMWKLLEADHPRAANRLESLALRAVTGSPDTTEGITAFREKRPPRFTQRLADDLPDFYPWWNADE
ncbi:Enoyl-CoA hydratase [Frankia canadensis]|uniref:Enoyl-CoA hydratase n=1 Tax=Frankia canadensis TaxID=1836972 RepID=A0A2I2L2Z2_9ACTN|nr:enoyl-CoA hydratase-related protein [Frankia canadensis]SNQ52237.1 Enoyl-CoA hydratase [Frankia canadensis]SOU59527.1 Enoyl-CoA hydratase [Frankia canadensis]